MGEMDKDLGTQRRRSVGFQARKHMGDGRKGDQRERHGILLEKGTYDLLRISCDTVEYKLWNYYHSNNSCY